MSGFILNPGAVGDPNQTPRVQLVGFRPPRHPYLPDAGSRVLVEAQRPCASCSLPKQNRVHDLPETPPEARDRDARRAGRERGRPVTKDELIDMVRRYGDLRETPPAQPEDRSAPVPEDADSVLHQIRKHAGDDMYQRVYADTQVALDEILGPEEGDDAGEGLVADVRLVGEQRDEARAAIDRVRALQTSRIGADEAIGRLVGEDSTVSTAFYAGVSFALAKVHKVLNDASEGQPAT